MKNVLELLIGLFLIAGTIGCGGGNGGDVDADYTNWICPDSNRSIDIVRYQAGRGGAWFTVCSSALPAAALSPEVRFDVGTSALENRRNGALSSTLVSGYFFATWNITAEDLKPYIHTVKGVFLRTSNPFFDYLNDRVLGWDGKSTAFSADIRGIVRLCNQRKIPVFMQMNYTDYVPGAYGTGSSSLQTANNITNTIAFLSSLKAAGLRLDGMTFGDEIGDEGVYGTKKPTVYNSDLIGRFILYAHDLKSSFPELKIYALDSYIQATRGRVSENWDYFQRIHNEELTYGMDLIDGFVFRESYVYIDQANNVRPSQEIVDDTESLYRNTTVYRYDVDGTTHPNPDAEYLPKIIAKINDVFGRVLDVGITEYLPAGPVNISEIDTSRYADMDFILHYADVVGIYGQLGLDMVSTIMFGNDPNMHKAYFDRFGNRGPNYPVHEQLAKCFTAEMLKVDRSVDYDTAKVKVYAAYDGAKYFVLILNKDVANEKTVQIVFPADMDLKIRLPRRSYTSLLVRGNSVVVSGIGN